MKHGKFLMLSVAACPILMMSCTEKAGKKEDGTAAVTETKKEMVRVTDLEEQEISRSVQIASTLEALNEVHLAPSVPGKIDEILVEIGDNVKAGQALVKMDDVQLVQSRIQMDNLKTDFSRLDTLKKVGSIAKQQYDQMATQYEVARKNIDYLAKNTTLTAPFDGVI